jgi:hypothetical protein
LSNKTRSFVLLGKASDIGSLAAGTRWPQRCFVSTRNREGRAARLRSGDDEELVAESLFLIRLVVLCTHKTILIPYD